MLGIPSPVIVALLGLIGVALTTVGGVMIAKINTAQKHAKVAAEQTANSHHTNLRDDIDTLTRLVRDVQRDVGGIREENRDDRRATDLRFNRLESRHDDLEKTIHTHLAKETS